MELVTPADMPGHKIDEAKIVDIFNQIILENWNSFQSYIGIDILNNRLKKIDINIYEKKLYIFLNGLILNEYTKTWDISYCSSTGIYIFEPKAGE